jgi:calmodulin
MPTSLPNHGLTQEQVDDLKASFDMFDKDRSGKFISAGPYTNDPRNLFIMCLAELHFYQVIDVVMFIPSSLLLFLISPYYVGSISHSELKSVMRRFGQNLSDSEVRDMIRSVDVDRNNEIDFNEFLHLMKSRISNDPDYELKLAFQMIDTDSSGTISIDELRQLMRKVNQQLSEEEITAIMHECDEDNNRELDFEEFKKLMVSLLLRCL